MKISLRFVAAAAVFSLAAFLSAAPVSAQTAAGFAAEREQAAKVLQSRLERLDGGIVESTKRLEQAPAEMRPTVQARLDKMKAQRERAAENLRKVQAATAETWDGVKKTVAESEREENAKPAGAAAGVKFTAR